MIFVSSNDVEEYREPAEFVAREFLNCLEEHPNRNNCLEKFLESEQLTAESKSQWLDFIEMTSKKLGKRMGFLLKEETISTHNFVNTKTGNTIVYTFTVESLFEKDITAKEHFSLRKEAGKNFKIYRYRIDSKLMLK